MYPKRWSKLWVSILIGIISSIFIATSALAAPVSAVNNIKQTAQKDTNMTKKENVPEAPKPLKHIIYIVIEGMTNPRIEGFNVPNLKGILATGIKANEVITQTPPTLQLVLRDLLFQGHRNLLEEKNEQKVEGLMDYFKKADKTTAFIDSKEGDLTSLVKSSDILVNIPQKNDSTVMNRAIEIFNEKKPYFMGIVLSDLAREAKDDNPKSKSIVDVDKEIGKLFYKLTEQGLFDNTLFVITGTNGGMKAANSQTDDILTWAIIRGPGIKSGFTSPAFRLTDILPTMKFIYNGTNQSSSEGKVIWNIIRKNGSDEQYLLNKRVADLSNEQIEHYNNLYEMYKMKKKLTVEQQRVTKEKGEIKNIITSKDNYIKELRVKIAAFKVLGIIFFAVFIFGYIIEYFILRKRFLLF